MQLFFVGATSIVTGSKHLLGHNARRGLIDCGRLQEQEAVYVNRRGYSKHHPAKSLYAEEDAQRTLKLFDPLSLYSHLDIKKGGHVLLRSVGYIPGAATFYARKGEEGKGER
ncbi:hypothetical protein D3C84_380080 [compost metagenome]